MKRAVLSASATLAAITFAHASFAATPAPSPAATIPASPTPVAAAASPAAADLAPRTARPMTTIIDGVVTYPYLDGVPVRVVCAADTTCDLRLQRGEAIRDIVSPASTKRIGRDGWLIEQGSGGCEHSAKAVVAESCAYLYITPSASSPQSNAIVTTTRRRYTLRLIPLRSDFTSYAFAYADRAPTAPGPTATPRAVDHEFTIAGDAAFRPIDVERDGDLTRIAFDPKVATTHPDVIEVRKSHQPKGADALVPVGWTYEDATHTLVVAGIFPTLMLYTGTGAERTKVLISRKVAP